MEKMQKIQPGLVTLYNIGLFLKESLSKQISMEKR